MNLDVRRGLPIESCGSELPCVINNVRPLFSHLQEDLVWKIVWVSSAKDENLDQVLDEVDVPPDVGINKVTLVLFLHKVCLCAWMQGRCCFFRYPHSCDAFSVDLRTQGAD